MSRRKPTTGVRGSRPGQEIMTRMKIAIERIQARIWMNRTAASIGLSSQPPRFVVGGLYGLDEGEAEGGLLQRPQPPRGPAGGGRRAARMPALVTPAMIDITVWPVLSERPRAAVGNSCGLTARTTIEAPSRIDAGLSAVGVASVGAAPAHPPPPRAAAADEREFHR